MRTSAALTSIHALSPALWADFVAASSAAMRCSNVAGEASANAKAGNIKARAYSLCIPLLGAVRVSTWNLDDRRSAGGGQAIFWMSAIQRSYAEAPLLAADGR